MRRYFLSTERVGFSTWEAGDTREAVSLWGDPDVTRYICASGVYSEDDVLRRLADEMRIAEEYGVQYFPIFRREGGELIGCCGLHPHGEGEYELGFHLRPEFWRQGYAREAASAMIGFAFGAKGARSLFAGHNPDNTASCHVLRSLGFTHIGDERYAPTGKMHPSYRLERGAEAAPAGEGSGTGDAEGAL